MLRAAVLTSAQSRPFSKACRVVVARVGPEGVPFGDEQPRHFGRKSKLWTKKRADYCRELAIAMG